MDIDKMKESWDALNSRLEKSETVNSDAIKKLLSSKAKGSYDRLRNRELAGVIAGCFACIMFVVMFLSGRMQHWYSFVVLESISVIATFYGFCCLRALPNWRSGYGNLATMMKATARYKKLLVYNRPILLGVMVAAIATFFCMENKGFGSAPKFQVIFWLTMCLIIWSGTSGLKLIREQIAEADEDLEELKRFIGE